MYNIFPERKVSDPIFPLKERCLTLFFPYEDCYTDPDGGPFFLRHYKPYQENSSNPTYKSYTNTEQSMYANIKDGLGNLTQKLYAYDQISTSTTINSIEYSSSERMMLSATAAYNGGCTVNEYLGRVAEKLETIDTYFPTATSSDIIDLIDKMKNVASTTTCVQLHSPGSISLSDSKNNTVGVRDGKIINDFPLAIVDKDLKYAKILGANPETDYRYEVQGTDKGIYGLDIVLNGFSQMPLVFKSVDIPILPGQVHTYSFDRERLKEGTISVLLEVDRDGDGKPERIINTGDQLDAKTYNLEATEEELDAVKYGHGSDSFNQKQETRSKVPPQPSDSFKIYHKRESDYDPNKETIIPLNQEILNVR